MNIPKRSRGARASWCGVMMLVAVGCSSSADGGVKAPATPAGAALAFVLDVMNGTNLTAADVAAHFSPSFLATVPASELQGVAAQLAAYKTWTLTGFDGTPTALALTAVVTRNDRELWRVTIAMNASMDTLIDGLTIDGAADLDPTLQTWDAVDQQLRAVAPGVSELASTIDDTTGCAPLHALDADTSRPLGSQFKLYVLAALASGVASGAHAWSEPLAIQEAYKSLPSGTFQNQPVGTTFSLEQFADNMISQSDNTAADHLIGLLGRDQVEAMLTTAKHHDPTEDQPFLTTREFFDLKLLVTEPARQAYIADGLADKRAVLAGYDATLDPRTFNGAFATPVDPDTIEWFATPHDLCNVMTTLKTFADQPATSAIYDVLSINPGIADEAHLFSYVGYKGGSEPGVLSLSWLVERAADQTWRFYSVELSNPQATIDEDRAIYLAGAARALVGR